jgi:hypothetical protein
MFGLIFFAVCAIIAIFAYLRWAPKKPPVNMVGSPEDYDDWRREQLERKRRRKAAEKARRDKEINDAD